MIARVRGGEWLSRLAPDRLRNLLISLPPKKAWIVLAALGLFSGLSASPIHFF